MKRLILLITLVAIGVSDSIAQKSETAIGINLNYGSKISNYGFGVKFQYGITSTIRIEPSFNYYLEKDKHRRWDANVNMHYLFYIAERGHLYPLVGLGYTVADLRVTNLTIYPNGNINTIIYGYNDKKIMMNFGIGGEYYLSHYLSIGTELKYQSTKNFNQFVCTLGLKYIF